MLPDWLQEVWELYQLIGTQRRENGALDYNPAIALVAAAGATHNLWTILELLQVIEVESAKKQDGAAGG